MRSVKMSYNTDRLDPYAIDASQYIYRAPKSSITQSQGLLRKPLACALISISLGQPFAGIDDLYHIHTLLEHHDGS